MTEMQHLYFASQSFMFKFIFAGYVSINECLKEAFSLRKCEEIQNRMCWPISLLSLVLNIRFVSVIFASCSQLIALIIL